MSWNSEDWRAFLAGTLKSVGEGFANNAQGNAGTGASGAGAAGVVQYDNQATQAYVGDKQAIAGVPVSWLVIGGAVVLGIVLLKKAL